MLKRRWSRVRSSVWTKFFVCLFVCLFGEGKIKGFRGICALRVPFSSLELKLMRICTRTIVLRCKLSDVSGSLWIPELLQREFFGILHWYFDTWHQNRTNGEWDFRSFSKRFTFGGLSIVYFWLWSNMLFVLEIGNHY